MIKAYILAFMTFALAATPVAVCAANAAVSPGASALEQLNKTLNAASSIQFKAIVKMAQDPSKPESALLVQAVEQGRGMIKATAVDPLSNSLNGASLQCDGKSYWAVSDSLNQYSVASAPKDGFEPDSPATMHFIYDVIGGKGQAMLNACEEFFPADFNIADDPVAPGGVRKLVASIVPVVVNGRKCDDIVQRLTTLHGVHVIHTVLDARSRALVQCALDSVKDGKTRNVMTVTYITLVLGKSTLPASGFTYTPKPTMQAYVAPASPGMAAPEFTVTKSDGTQVHLSDFKGKVVLIDFWATWCGPCRVTLPGTDKLAAKYQPLGVVFLPVCTWDTKKNFDDWVATHSSWNMAWDFDSAAEDETKSIANKLYAVSAIPTQYIVGKDGTISYVCFADTDAGEKPVTDALDKALAAPIAVASGRQ